MGRIKGAAASTFFLILFGMSIFILPTNAAATVSLGTSGYTETTITLTWSQSGDTLFSNYKLYMSSTGTNGPYTQIWSTTSKSQTSTYVDNIAPNTNYWFYIKDTDLLGSANSNTFQVSTCNTPQLTITSRTTTTVSLQWNDYNSYSSLVPFNSYVIQMSTNGGPLSTLTTVTDSSQNTYSVTGLSPATYVFSMNDEVGTSGQYTSTSNEATVVIHSPVQVQISSSATSVNVGQQVQLTASASGGTNSYNYQWFSNGNPIAGATAASYTYVPTEEETVNIYATAQDTQDSLLAVATSNSITLTATQASTSTPEPTPTPELTLPIVLLALAIVTCSAILVKVVKQKAPKSHELT